jgi:hypothetical protein
MQPMQMRSSAIAAGALVLVLLLVLSAACGPGAKPAPAAPVPAAPVPVTAPGDDQARGCAVAAAGLEQGTRGLRDPEVSVLAPMRARCMDDGWSPAAMECFGRMTEGDLGRCAGLLPAKARERMFEQVGGGARDRVAVAIALAKLSALKVGIPECDRFVEVVAHVLVCDRMAIEVRAQLGTETADFWALPKSGLPADAQLRMADVCGRSTAALEQQAVEAGCAP